MRWLGSIAVHAVLGVLLLQVGHRTSAPQGTVTIELVPTSQRDDRAVSAGSNSAGPLGSGDAQRSGGPLEMQRSAPAARRAVVAASHAAPVSTPRAVPASSATREDPFELGELVVEPGAIEAVNDLDGVRGAGPDSTAGGDAGSDGAGGGGGRGRGGRGKRTIEPRDAVVMPVALPAAPVSKARPAILVFPSRQTAVEDAALYIAEVIVDDEGFVVGSKLARGFGGPRDVQAGAQVWRFRYSPALDDSGRPIRSTVQQKFAVAW